MTYRSAIFASSRTEFERGIGKVLRARRLVTKPCSDADGSPAPRRPGLSRPVAAAFRRRGRYRVIWLDKIIFARRITVQDPMGELWV
jgi:hypothetical protein